MSRCGSAYRGWAAARCRVLPLGECGVCRARMTLKADLYAGGDVRTTSHVPTPTRADSRGPLTDDRSFQAPFARRRPHPRTPGQPEPYPFEGRPQADEGDGARTKRALADIGVGRCLLANRRKDVHPSASRVSRCYSTGRAASSRWRAAALNDPVSATARAYHRPSMLKCLEIIPTS